MSASAIPTRPDLVSVKALLTQLVTQADAGDWEAVTAIESEVCQQLACLQLYYNARTELSPSTVDRSKLAEIATLINRAELACTIRRDQIGPLVSSLKALPSAVKA